VSNVGTWTAFGLSAASLAVSVAAFIRAGRWRTQERREASPELEVIANRRFTLDYENLSANFVRAEIIAQNKSSGDVPVTRIGLKLVGSETPAKLVGEGLPETVGRGKALYRSVPSQDFKDILGLAPSAVAGEPKFLVYVESGHGSTRKRWNSAPFSLVSSRELTGQYDEWTE